MLFVIAAWARPMALAVAPPAIAGPATLAITQIKITGDEFAVLQNNSGADIADLSSYWLDEFNSYNPLDSGVSSSVQQLPAVKLGAGQTLLLSAAGTNTCGAAATAKLSVSLGDSAGFLQIVQTSLTSLGVTQVPVDSVSWSSAANGQIQNVPSSSKDPKGMYYRYANGGTYRWQLADLDISVPCQLDVSAGGSINVPLAKANSPIPSIVGVSGGGSGGSIPADDIGLSAPQLSEILPNPATPQTDANDEFIELYNPNTKPFDLGGFILQVGLSTTHKYTFPDNTFLQPQQFGVFYSSDTGLSLSNSSGQVEFLDPSGTVLEQSDIYSTAKDNYAWVFAQGSWQWTTAPTPGAKNVITAPPGSKKDSASTSSNKSVVLAAKSGGSANSSGGSTAAGVSKLHPSILAGVGLLALLYALYEYRHDLAAALYRLQRYRAARRETGQPTERPSGLRTTL